MNIGKTQPIQYSKSVNYADKKAAKENKTQTSPQNNSKTSKAILGLSALAASAIAALALKGRSSSLKALESLKPFTEAVQNSKNLDVALFKKIGKFDKGKAFVADKPYTGNIYTKNGFKITYKDGVLQRSESVSRASNGEPLKFKNYDDGKLYFSRNNDYKNVGQIKDTVVERMQDGTVVMTAKRGGYDGKLQPECNDIITTIKPDGTATKVEQNLEKYRQGLDHRIIYDKTTNLNTGEIKLTKKEIKDSGYYFGAKDTIKNTKIVDGQKVYERVGKDGKVTSWTQQYNAKTGVVTKTIKKPDGNIETVMSDKRGNVLVNRNGNYTFDSCVYSVKDHYIYDNPFGFLGTSKETMQAFIKEHELPFVI